MHPLTLVYSKLFCCILCCRSFNSWCLSSRSFLRTTCTSGLLGSFLSHVFIVVNQLDKTHLRIITCTETSLDDSGITTRTVSNLY